MPQGLQVWDASGNLIVDTSTFVLKEISINTNVTASNTSDNFIPVTLPAGAVPAPSALVTNSGGSNDGPPDVEWDAANSRIKYRFGSTGSRQADIKMLLV